MKPLNYAGRRLLPKKRANCITKTVRPNISRMEVGILTMSSKVRGPVIVIQQSTLRGEITLETKTSALTVSMEKLLMAKEVVE